MIQRGIEVETMSVHDYNKWEKESGEELDSATRKLFEELIVEEEKHLDTFQIEMENSEKFKDNYLALQSLERTKASAMGKNND